MEFVDSTLCQECRLWGTAKHRGIMTRPHWVSDVGRSKAVLFIGEAPGFNEDKEGISWIGYAGNLLTRFINMSGMQNFADIYLGNTCRCLKPRGVELNAGMISCCKKWLMEDIRRLQTKYEEVVLVCCGAPAAKSIFGIKSLASAFRKQGTKTDYGCPVFATYHPAVLHPSRQPAKVTAVESHFVLIVRYLAGEFVPCSIQVEPEVGAPLPKNKPDVFTIDIETYGILEKYKNQHTQMIPAKSALIDKIPAGKQVLTTSICYRDENGDLRTPLYIMENQSHRNILEKWLSLRDTILNGQNIKFDIGYLRFNDIAFHWMLNPNEVYLDDTLILSFLLYEQQPERGLKEQSLLFGIANYDVMEVTAGKQNAKDAYDPKLHEYNCFDSAVAHVFREDLLRRIQIKYGDDSPKLSKICADHRNAILWNTIELERNGITFSRRALRNCYKDLRKKYRAAETILRKDKGLIIHGKGSEKSRRDFVSSGVEAAGLLGDGRVAYTSKTKKVGRGIENVELVLTHLSQSDELYPYFERFKDCIKTEHVIDSYAVPLITNPHKGICFSRNGTGFAYPSWFPVPSYSGKEAQQQETTGGTIQARYSAKRPACQTFPPEVEKTKCSRYEDGVIVEWDSSQTELRVGALLSGDEPLMEDFKNGISPHITTAKTLYPQFDWNIPQVKKEERQREYTLCKSVNFLVLYRGGAFQLQKTARQDCGLELDLYFCKGLVEGWYNKHPQFEAWQGRLIKTVKEKGYYELPTGWSRTFTTSDWAVQTYINEICNFPIQTLAAQLIQSIQFAILRDVDRMVEQTRILMINQRHDSIAFDCPKGELDNLRSIVKPYFLRPPLLPFLEDYYGRTVPFDYEEKLYE